MSKSKKNRLIGVLLTWVVGIVAALIFLSKYHITGIAVSIITMIIILFVLVDIGKLFLDTPKEERVQKCQYTKKKFIIHSIIAAIFISCLSLYIYDIAFSADGRYIRTEFNSIAESVRNTEMDEFGMFFYSLSKHSEIIPSGMLYTASMTGNTIVLFQDMAVEVNNIDKNKDNPTISRKPNVYSGKSKYLKLYEETFSVTAKSFVSEIDKEAISEKKEQYMNNLQVIMEYAEKYALGWSVIMHLLVFTCNSAMTYCLRIAYLITKKSRIIRRNIAQEEV